MGRHHSGSVQLSSHFPSSLPVRSKPFPQHDPRQSAVYIQYESGPGDTRLVTPPSTQSSLPGHHATPKSSIHQSRVRHPSFVSSTSVAEEGPITQRNGGGKERYKKTGEIFFVATTFKGRKERWGKNRNVITPSIQQRNMGETSCATTESASLPRRTRASLDDTSAERQDVQ